MSRKKTGISFEQFFTFFDKTYQLWKPIYSFHLAMLKTFFPNSCFRVILERKKNIQSIKGYQKLNSGNFPVTYSNTCYSRLISRILHKPNPNEYDYDLYLFPYFKYGDFVKVFIGKYKNGYVGTFFHFRLKHLNNVTENYIINEIDQLYVLFDTRSERKNTPSMKSPDTSFSFYSSSSSKYKHTDSYDKPLCSILRDSSNGVHSRRIYGKSSRILNLKPTISDTVFLENKEKL